MFSFTSRWKPRSQHLRKNLLLRFLGLKTLSPTIMLKTHFFALMKTLPGSEPWIVLTVLVSWDLTGLNVTSFMKPTFDCLYDHVEFWEMMQSCWCPLFLILSLTAPYPGRWKGTSSWKEGKGWKAWAWEQCPKKAEQIHMFSWSMPSRSSRVKYLAPSSQICVICLLTCGSWGRWQVQPGQA